jgi:glycerol-3-phosphate acyltransferase PlsY
LLVLLVWAIALAVTRWIALASVAAATSVLVIAVVSGKDIAWAAALAIIVAVRHRSNFARRLDLR